MCGLVGYCSIRADKRHANNISRLFVESTVRGLHAFGVAYYDDFDDAIYTYKSFDKDAIALHIANTPRQDIITHARYSQSGDWADMQNNHPVSVGDYHLVFNGVISMATKEEMEQQFGWPLDTYNDGELFIRHMMAGGDPVSFIKDIGSFAGLWYAPDGYVYALRNERRPLWYLLRNSHVYYASTRDIFIRVMGEEVRYQVVECEPNVVYDLWKQVTDVPF